jgi:anti-sigma B factor antagonist
VEISSRRRDDGVIEIAIEGELDLSNAAQLRDALFDAVEQDGAGVWIDFERCSFIDSTGLRVIVEGARRIPGDYARLGITNLNAQPKRLFELTMMSRSELLRFA